MAGVQDTDIIDAIATNATECALVMIEERPWDSDSDQPMQLREKINTYANYVLDGSLARNYPDAVGLKVRLQIDCAEPPTDAIADILAYGAGQLEEHDIRIVVNVRGPS